MWNDVMITKIKPKKQLKINEEYVYFLCLYNNSLSMEIAITVEKKWFSAHVPQLHISSEGETFDELIKNIQEALEIYYEEEKDYNKNLLKNWKMYFNMENLKHAVDHKIIA